ncbi:hypothetical protein CQA62_03730 [Helicobacter cholecystus]|uniref:Uncharacterized protein n=1 Tax=Helicobacter cholecystus TaxID=45498 RepID=A0A3D8IVF6_9HELI|nr:group III truncated hemoglobin [Helicobacter cholecystus]RDU69259.1 hypothetical protein CQA62_03730 [Helicobacter cholecystus]VEJ24337.1 Group 3 truncated hemoglobin ctb [Helicobacter cholecystus]
MSQITPEKIQELMDIFYAKVRVNPELGEIFNHAIGTSNEEWEVHKKKIGNFWMGMLLGEGDYQGNPMKAHIELPPFPRELFSVWLNLFEECLNKIFNQDDAQIILQKAKIIAQRFQYMLYDVKH